MELRMCVWQKTSGHTHESEEGTVVSPYCHWGPRVISNTTGQLTWGAGNRTGGKQFKGQPLESTYSFPTLDATLPGGFLHLTVLWKIRLHWHIWSLGWAPAGTARGGYPGFVTGNNKVAKMPKGHVWDRSLCNAPETDQLECLQKHMVGNTDIPLPAWAGPWVENQQEMTGMIEETKPFRVLLFMMPDHTIHTHFYFRTRFLLRQSLPSRKLEIHNWKWGFLPPPALQVNHRHQSFSPLKLPLDMPANTSPRFSLRIASDQCGFQFACLQLLCEAHPTRGDVLTLPADLKLLEAV